ncbi:MAG: phosphoadenosine phosphosulfate reductase family protein, partial [Pseudomonadota bacterium]
MEKEEWKWTLEEKEAKSLEILREALERHKGKIATTFTGGKDSLTVLHLLKRLGDGQVPIPVLNLDTTVKFPQIIEFRDRMAREWNLELIITTNTEGLKEINLAIDHDRCCQVMKTEAINMAVEKHGWDALIT